MNKINTMAFLAYSDAKAETKRIDLIKAKFLEWTSDSTGHGVNHIFKASNLFICVMWSVCFTCSIAMCSFLIITTVDKFFKFEVSSQIERVNAEETGLPFPQVTICNYNYFATRKAADNYVLSSVRKRYGRNVSTLSHLFNLTDAEEFRAFMNKLRVRTLASDFNKTLRKTFGLTLNEMIIKCTFNQEACNLTSDFVEYFDSVFGNCFRFNSGANQMPVRKTKRTGRNYGLTLYLFTGIVPHTDPARVFSINDEFSGIHLTINNQSNLPLPTESFDAKPGVCTSVIMEKTLVQSPPSPYSACTDIASQSSFLVDEIRALNFTYRRQNCLDLCDQYFIINECGW
jgi:hypothetical protein